MDTHRVRISPLQAVINLAKLAALPSIGMRSIMSGCVVCIHGKSSDVHIPSGIDPVHTHLSMLAPHVKRGYTEGSSTYYLAFWNLRCVLWSGLQGQARDTTFIGWEACTVLSTTKHGLTKSEQI